MLSKKNYLILGISTDIGKSFFVENLCKKLPNSSAIKPISSGFCDDDKNSDSARILAALGFEISRKNLDEISPWRFETPTSPHFAGKIDFVKLVDFCQKKIAQARAEDKFLFIEAAGGVMTPINNEKTFLDLARKLQIPVLLVSANYLGSISHTLCAIEALKSRKILIEKIIINEHLPHQEKDSLADNLKIAQTIENIGGVETIMLTKFFEKKS